MTAWIPERWALGISQTGLLVCAGVWLAAAALRSRRMIFHPILSIPAGVVLLGAAQIGLGITVNRWETLAAAAAWLAHGAAMLLAVQIGADTRLRSPILEALHWLASMVAVAAVIQVYTTPGKVFGVFDSGFPDRVLGPFVYHNKYAQFAELMLPITLFRAVADSGKVWSSMVLASTMFAGIVAGGSRSGFAIAIVEILVFGAVIQRGGWLDRRHSLRVAAKALFILIAAGGVVGWEFIQTRFRLDPLTDVRLPIMRSTVEMIAERPSLGFGLGGWAKAYPKFASFDNGLYVNQAHCDWLQWTAEAGLPMLGMMLALAFWSLRLGLAHPWSLGAFFVLLHGLVDYPMQQVPQLATLVLVVAALAAGEWKSRRERRNPVEIPQESRTQ
ncbi:MAG: O-antigen ligase family protein [Bryobacteraceae bacterium]|nr:O-antigen ligase family protein [Bryobacteraceae bacterium]